MDTTVTHAPLTHTYHGHTHTTDTHTTDAHTPTHDMTRSHEAARVRRRILLHPRYEANAQGHHESRDISAWVMAHII